MKSLAGLVAGFVVLTALSGCFADDAPPASTDGTTQATGATTGTNATSGPIAGAPVAVIGIADNGTALNQTNGTFTAMVGLNLTFDASNSSDPNGDEITFAWDFGDGGSDSEAIAVHAFTTEGNFTVALTVTDATGLTNSTSAVLNITAGAAAPAYYFLDDADTPTKWTFSKKLYAEGEDTGQNHPLAAGWHASTKDKLSGTKSWSFQDEADGGYHDNELTIMTSDPIDLTGVKTAFLSLAIKGDSEVGSGDDLYIEASKDAGATWVSLSSTDKEYKEWTVLSFDMVKALGDKVQLRFRFTSDLLCSKDSPLPEGCGAGTYTGYFLDDIMIGPTNMAPEE